VRAGGGWATRGREGAGHGWAANRGPRGEGARGAGWAVAESRPKGGGDWAEGVGGGAAELGRGTPAQEGEEEGNPLFYLFFLFSHYPFPSNLLLSAYFMETKQIPTREIDAWIDMMQQPKKPTSRIY
jgi:hypothetical protein